MSRDVPDIVVFALVVAVAISAVAVPVSALDGSTTAATVAGGEPVAQQTADGASGTNDSASNGTVAPGQRLAGVVGVQGAELDGEIEDRELEQRVASADSNASKAAVVATELNTARERLQTLRERRDRLREARQSGDMSPGEYRARMAVTAAQVQSLQRQLNTSERVSRDLPDAALEARGVNRSEIDQLQRNTDELTGPEIAEIARDIASNGNGSGPVGRADSARRNAGNGAGNGPPDETGERVGEPSEDTGARDDAGNATRMPNTPTNQSSNRASNRSTTGSPDGAGQPEDAGSGNSDGAGESGPPDGAGGADDSGNATDGSGASGSETDGGSDGTGDSGNSNSGGNSGNGGNSNSGGNSDNAGDGRP